MPIYAYRCQQCGHAKDVIQKFSDAPINLCPACGADAFRKQLTAPAFQLKGGGWYVTDFRDSGKGKASDAKPANGSSPEASGTGSVTSSASSPAPAAASGQSASGSASSGTGNASGAAAGGSSGTASGSTSSH